MGLLLHLTDLHLGPRGGDTTTADAKVRVIPTAELETRLTAAKETFRQIASRMAGRRFSAVIISGDITVGNSLEGFDQLKRFLDDLKDLLPVDRRGIVVVPGNHDVDWTKEPSTPERYANFKRAVRDGLDATTPFLEGLDDLKSAAWESGKADHYRLDAAEGWAILPLNSSNYCGSNAVLAGITDPELAAFMAAITAVPKAKEVAAALERLRRYDIARISPNQFDALRQLAAKACAELESGADPAQGRPPLLIAVTHHHLLPVSDDEEIKPFESFTNLGKLRDELRDSKISLLLHGHKHKLAAYWDRQEVVGQSQRDLLVLSGASIGGEGYDKKNPCRIVEITPVAGGHSVTVMSAQEFISTKTKPTVKASHILGSWVARGDAGENTDMVVAETFDETYARVLSLPIFEAEPRTGVLNNVLVQIVNGKTVEDKVPVHYPQNVVEDPAKLNTWFTDIASWWQRELSELPQDIYFTHGMRIRRYDGVLDQLEHAVEVLKDRDPANGRAVVTLIDPELDLRKDGRKKLAGWFPAFSMAQIYYSRRGAGQDYLNIVGLFRKQELKYWWAINVRELRSILDELINRGVKGQIGSITTIATVAVADSERPRVAVPALDRWYDVDKSRIAYLVSSLVEACSAPSRPLAESSKAMWREVLIDLVPADVPPHKRLDNIPLTTKGLDLTRVLLEALAEHRPNEKLSALCGRMSTIHDKQRDLRELVSHSREDRSKSENKGKFAELRKSLAVEVNAIRAIIEEV